MLRQQAGTVPAALKGPRRNGMTRVSSAISEPAVGDGAPSDLSEMERLSEEAARLLKSLANPVRLRILCLLVEGEMAVGALASQLNLREPLVSQHLMRLRLEGIVTFRRQGTSAIYSMASEPAAAVLSTLYAYFCGPAKGDIENHEA